MPNSHVVQQCTPLGAARCREDLGAGPPCHSHRRLPDPAGRGMDQHLVTGGDPGQVMVEGPQADVVIAPGYEDGVVAALRKKRKNTRVLSAPPPEGSDLDVRQISGGFLVQTPHAFVANRDDWRVVTKRAPTEAEWRDAALA